MISARSLNSKLLVTAENALEQVRNEEKEHFSTVTRLKETRSILRTLPVDIYRHIFTAAAEQFGPKKFHSCRSTQVPEPPQLCLSSVCTEWRRIAHSTTELWNHVEIKDELSDRGVQDCHEWLKRAGSRPVNLAFYTSSGTWSLGGREFATFFQKIMSLQHLRVGKLYLCVYERQLLALDQLTPEAVAHLDIQEIRLSGHFSVLKKSQNIPHFLRHTRSLSFVIFKPEDALNFFMYQFPWARLHRLQCFFVDMKLNQVIQILQHMPLLEELNFTSESMRPDDPDIPSEAISLPHLHTLSMESYCSATESFPFFDCPNLINLEVDFRDYDITNMDPNIIRRLYNQRKLERFVFDNSFRFTPPSVPLFKPSAFLKEMPMLRELSSKYIILDEDAIAGIATGRLGQFLETLVISFPSDFETILNMLEARLQAAENSIQNGRIWHETVSSLKRVELWGKNIESGIHKERAEALRKAGIWIKLYPVNDQSINVD